MHCPTLLSSTIRNSPDHLKIVKILKSNQFNFDHVFVPLFNFQPGSDNFRNTCFIAAVANLRHVLHPVMNHVEDFNWKDYINFVRSSWNQKYEFAPGHNGQHDAAELLGNILHDHTSRHGVELCVTRVIYECGHWKERLETAPMIILSLPPEEGISTIAELREKKVYAC